MKIHFITVLLPLARNVYYSICVWPHENEHWWRSQTKENEWHRIVAFGRKPFQPKMKCPCSINTKLKNSFLLFRQSNSIPCSVCWHSVRIKTMTSHTAFSVWNASTDTNNTVRTDPCSLNRLRWGFVLWNSCAARNEFWVKNNISVFNESDTIQWKTV